MHAGKKNFELDEFSKNPRINQSRAAIYQLSCAIVCEGVP